MPELQLLERIGGKGKECPCSEDCGHPVSDHTLTMDGIWGGTGKMTCKSCEEIKAAKEGEKDGE